MPGIKTVLRNRSDVPDKGKLCDFVKEYWRYDNITCMTEAEFILNYNDWAKEKGYRQSLEKEKTIYHLASSGITAMASETSSTQVLVLEAVKILHKKGGAINDRPLQKYSREVDKRTEANKEMYNLRKQTVVHPFGTVKRAFGFSYFLTRGNENVKNESVMHFKFPYYFGKNLR